MKKLLLFYFLLFCVSFLFAQTKTDSLKLKLAIAISDSIRIEILQELYRAYQYDSIAVARASILQAIELAQKANQPALLAEGYNLYADLLSAQSLFDSAMVFYQQGLKLSGELDYWIGMSDALIGMGNNHWSMGDFKKAEAYHERNFQLIKKKGAVERMANHYNNRANIYTETGEYAKAMEAYTQASQLYIDLGKQQDYAITLGNIALVQRRLENYESARDYLLQSDSIYQLLDYKPGKAYVAYNLAVVYKNTGDLEQAIFYNLKALEGYKKLGNQKRLAYVLFTMGNIHWEQGNFQEALKGYQQSLDLSLKVKDAVNAGYSYKAIGDAFFQLKDYKAAKENLFKATEMAEKLGLNLVEMDAWESLSAIYVAEGNYKKAFQYLKHFQSVKDSFYTLEKRELAGEIEAKFQNAQKTREIELLESENELQALKLKKRINERNTMIGFGLLLILLATLLWNQFRIKQKSNKELQAFDQMRSAFFANVSHEFRTPLTLIKGPIDQLDHQKEAHLNREEVKMLKRNTNRLLQLVNQLLDMASLDAGNLKLEIGNGDVFQCLRTAASSFNSFAVQRKIDFRVAVPETPLWAAFDRDKVEKVVYNLLGNAFKFSDDGANISFQVSYHDQNLTIRVTDTGEGISAEQLPFIFDRFYQAHNSAHKTKEGTGIGLSITRELVNLMRGEITVESEWQKGSCFMVFLPIQPLTARPISAIQPLKHPGTMAETPAFQLVKTDKRALPTILLIEDNTDMRTFLKAQLLKHYRIIEAINGVEGLEKAKSGIPELIITDLMMPKMDGIELCEKLKTDLDTSHIPIIMLTAKAGVDNKIKGLQTGADEYLIKPFNGNELLVRVKNLIDQRRNLRRLFGTIQHRLVPQKLTVTTIDQQFLEQVIDLLETRSADPDFGPKEMQQALVVSKAQLHRKLKALTDETPGGLLRNFRLQRAAQLLSQEADSISQIAYQVGFNNLSYFAKCFKAHFGLSPSEYGKR